MSQSRLLLIASVSLLLIGLCTYLYKQREGYDALPTSLDGFTIYQVYNTNPTTSSFATPSIQSSSAGAISFSNPDIPFYLFKPAYTPSSLSKLYFSKNPDSSYTLTTDATKASTIPDLNTTMTLLHTLNPNMDILVYPTTDNTTYVLVGDSINDMNIDASLGTPSPGWNTYLKNKVPVPFTTVSTTDGRWLFVQPQSLPPNSILKTLSSPQSFDAWQRQALNDGYDMLSYPLSSVSAEPKATSNYAYMAKLSTLVSQYDVDGMDKTTPITFMGPTTTPMCFPYNDGINPRTGDGATPTTTQARVDPSTYSLNNIMVRVNATGGVECLSDDGVNCLPGVCWDGVSCLGDVCQDIRYATPIALPKVIPPLSSETPAEFNLADSVFGKSGDQTKYQLDFSALTWQDCPSSKCAPVLNDAYSKQFLKLKSIARDKSLGLFVFVRNFVGTGNLATTHILQGVKRNMCIEADSGTAFSRGDMNMSECQTVDWSNRKGGPQQFSPVDGSFLMNQYVRSWNPTYTYPPVYIAPYSSGTIGMMPNTGTTTTSVARWIQDPSGRIHNFNNVEQCLTFTPIIKREVLRDVTQYKDNPMGILGGENSHPISGYNYYNNGNAIVYPCTTENNFKQRWDRTFQQQWALLGNTPGNVPDYHRAGLADTKAQPPEQTWTFGYSNNLSCRSISQADDVCGSLAPYATSCLDTKDPKSGEQLQNYMNYCRDSRLDIFNPVDYAQAATILQTTYGRSVAPYPTIDCQKEHDSSDRSYCVKLDTYIDQCADKLSDVRNALNTTYGADNLLTSCRNNASMTQATYKSAVAKLQSKGLSVSPENLTNVSSDCFAASAVSDISPTDSDGSFKINTFFSKDTAGVMAKCGQNNSDLDATRVVTLLNNSLRTQQSGITSDGYTSGLAAAKTAFGAAAVMNLPSTFPTVSCSDSVIDTAKSNGNNCSKLFDITTQCKGITGKSWQYFGDQAKSCVQTNFNAIVPTQYAQLQSILASQNVSIPPLPNVDCSDPYADALLSNGNVCQKINDYATQCPAVRGKPVSYYTDQAKLCVTKFQNKTNATQYNAVRAANPTSKLPPFPTVSCDDDFLTTGWFCDKIGDYTEQCSQVSSKPMSFYADKANACLTNDQSRTPSSQYNLARSVLANNGISIKAYPDVNCDMYNPPDVCNKVGAFVDQCPLTKTLGYGSSTTLGQEIAREVGQICMNPGQNGYYVTPFATPGKMTRDDYLHAKQVLASNGSPMGQSVDWSQMSNNAATCNFLASNRLVFDSSQGDWSFGGPKGINPGDITTWYELNCQQYFAKDGAKNPSYKFVRDDSKCYYSDWVNTNVCVTDDKGQSYHNILKRYPLDPTKCTDTTQTIPCDACAYTDWVDPGDKTCTTKDGVNYTKTLTRQNLTTINPTCTDTSKIVSCGVCNYSGLRDTGDACTTTDGAHWYKTQVRDNLGGNPTCKDTSSSWQLVASDRLIDPSLQLNNQTVWNLFGSVFISNVTAAQTFADTYGKDVICFNASTNKFYMGTLTSMNGDPTQGSTSQGGWNIYARVPLKTDCGAVDPCSFYKDTDTNISQWCYNKLWKDAGCSTQVSGMSDFAKTQSKVGIKNQFAFLAGSTSSDAQKAMCYGDDRTKWPCAFSDWSSSICNVNTQSSVSSLTKTQTRTLIAGPSSCSPLTKTVPCFTDITDDQKNTICSTLKGNLNAKVRILATNGYVWTVASNAKGTMVWLAPTVSGNAPTQEFSYRSDGTLQHIASGLCVGAASDGSLILWDDCTSHIFFVDGNGFLNYYNKPGNWNTTIGNNTPQITSVGLSAPNIFKIVTSLSPDIRGPMNGDNYKAVYNALGCDSRPNVAQDKAYTCGYVQTNGLDVVSSYLRC